MTFLPAGLKTRPTCPVRATQTRTRWPRCSAAVPASCVPVDPATSDEPVVTATYCLPPTANVTGKPLTGAPRLISHSTLPVLSSNALKRPLASPPKTRPPPVATSDSMPGALLVLPQRLAGLRRDREHGADVVVRARRDHAGHVEAVHLRRIARVHRRLGVHAHVLQRHVHRVGVRAVGAGRPVLAAVAARADQLRLILRASRSSSGFTVTLPVAPSILLTTFCITVGRPHRNSPVRRSSV